jgi:hypothetical protein
MLETLPGGVGVRGPAGASRCVLGLCVSIALPSPPLPVARALAMCVSFLFVFICLGLCVTASWCRPVSLRVCLCVRCGVSLLAAPRRLASVCGGATSPSFATIAVCNCTVLAVMAGGGGRDDACCRVAASVAMSSIGGVPRDPSEIVSHRRAVHVCRRRTDVSDGRRAGQPPGHVGRCVGGCDWLCVCDSEC